MATLTNEDMIAHMIEHLKINNVRLSDERVRWNNSKSSKEAEYRKVWVRQIEKEIDGDIAYIEKLGGKVPEYLKPGKLQDGIMTLEEIFGELDEI